MNLLALPAFTDHCVWPLHDGGRAVVVDPGDAAPTIEALDAQQPVLAAILVTRRHADHMSNEPGVVLSAWRQWKNQLR